jgi:hypothetical protein
MKTLFQIHIGIVEDPHPDPDPHPGFAITLKVKF